jgi:signal transduction histidine kinase
VDDEQTRRGGALVVALLAFGAVGVLTSPITFLVPPDYRAQVAGIFVGTQLALGLGVVLARRGRVDAAGAIAGVSVSCVIAWSTVSMGLVTEAIWFLGLGLLVASFASSPRVVGLVYAVDLVLLGLVQSQIPVLVHAGDKVPLLPSVLSLLTSLALTAALNAEFANRSLRRMRDAQQVAELARAAAEEASRAKSVFLANMSHELRTPLNAILGYSDLLLEELEDLPEASRTDLSRIQTSGRHLLTLISDVLDLSRIETGRMEIRKEGFDVAPLVSDLVRMVLPSATARGNNVRFTVSGDASNVVTDRTRLAQILTNLLANAAKFTRDGEIELAVRRRDGGTAWSVRDTGIGMDPETLDRVFEPFVQGDGSSTKIHGGAGIGLALCRRLALLLEGRLDVVSAPGQGSTFTLWLPDP